MKKLVFILSIVICVLGIILIYKSVNTNVIKEYLKFKYPNEAFSVQSVGIDIKTMEIVAHICDSEGIESTVRKKNRAVYSDYELDKAKSLIENEYAKVLRESEVFKYINSMDLKILERIEYSEIADSLNPVIYLTIAFNDKITGKRDFAQVSHDVIRTISKSKYNNVGTYVFGQTAEHYVMNLIVYSEDFEAGFDTLLNKIEVVEEIKAD